MVVIWRCFEMSWNLDKKHRHHVCSLFTLGSREGAPGPEAVPTYQGLSPNPTWSRDGRLVQTIACHKYRITPNDLSPESSWCQLQLQAPFAWLGHWLFACIFEIIYQHDNAQNNTLGNMSALFFDQAMDQMGQKCRYLARNASFRPNLAVSGPKNQFLGGKK